jgi:hypothetical protein
MAHNARLGGGGTVWLVRLELTGAPCYTAMVLRFQCFFILWNQWGARNSTRGSSTGGELWSRMRGGKVQASTFGDGGGKLQGMAHDKVGQNGCGVGCRTSASGWWKSRSVAHGTAMKGVNLGFASIFFKILAQGPSIYRGFGLMISCVCRTTSPSFPLGRGFGFDRFFWDFSLWWQLPAQSAIRRGVGEDLVLGHSWAAHERSQGRLG